MSVRDRVVLVVNDAPFFLSHRLPLALAARAAGYDVHVAVPGASGRMGEIEASGLPWHDTPIDRSGAKPWHEARSVASLVRLYRTLRPRLVHHVTIKPVLYGSLAARLANVECVINAVSGLGFVFMARGAGASLRRRAVESAYRLAFHSPSTRLIVQNSDDRALFLARGMIDPARCTLIRGSGVDLTKFAPRLRTESVPVVVCACRMLWDKGVGEFVEAARSIRARGGVARFVLVGGTDVNRAAVPEAQLEAWRAEGVVEWWGQREDMAHVLADATIVCLPSYAEGMPKVLLEAAACGRPVITTTAHGCRESVRDGETGLLVPPRDAAALAAAIEHLLRDTALAERMGRSGREMAVAEFGVDRVIGATLALYDELLRR